MTEEAPALLRRLGTSDAVVVGLGAMIGAGVFAAMAPAAHAAGAGLLVGLVVAAAIAYCNATSSAQLAAQHPVSGGTYHYGRAQLGPWWGFTAGWGFVIGKTASCAAMALTFAAYAVPGSGWLQRVVAVVTVVGLTAANQRGITKTALLTRVLVVLSLLALLLVVGLCLFSGDADPARLTSGWGAGGSGVYGVLQAAGLLFFAFAGYARIATLGEEVRDPSRTIPRAIVTALAIVAVLYLLVGASALLAAGPEALATSTAPLTTAVNAVGAAFADPLVRVGACVASLGSLLVLMAGVGRTSMAMARNHDLPNWLSAVHPVHRVPYRAQLVVAAVVAVLVLTVDLREVIGFSSFGVLVYYGIANLSASTQQGRWRRFPKALNFAGVVGCAVLVVTLPVADVVAGVVMFGIGLAGRKLARIRQPVSTPR